MKKAVIYARVSTQKEEQSQSLPSQISQLLNLAMRQKYEVVEIIQERRSGKNLNREGVIRALKMVVGDADILLVCDLDRLTRETADIQYLKKISEGRFKIETLAKKIDLESSVGVLENEILTCAAKYLRAQCAEKIRRVLGEKRKKGEKLGGYRKFGFDVVVKEGKKINVENKKERRIIKKMMKKREAGESYGKIADYLEKRRVLTVQKKENWSAVAVMRILKREEKNE